MRADRPVLAAAIFLAAGLSLIFCYGISASGLNAALPVANSGFHLSVSITGPAAIGGVVLTLIGLFFFIWAVLAALSWHWRLMTGRERARERAAAIPMQNPPGPSRYEPTAPAEGQRRYM